MPKLLTIYKSDMSGGPIARVAQEYKIPSAVRRSASLVAIGDTAEASKLCPGLSKHCQSCTTPARPMTAPKEMHHEGLRRGEDNETGDGS